MNTFIAQETCEHTEGNATNTYRQRPQINVAVHVSFLGSCDMSKTKSVNLGLDIVQSLHTLPRFLNLSARPHSTSVQMKRNSIPKSTFADNSVAELIETVYFKYSMQFSWHLKHNSSHDP